MAKKWDLTTRKRASRKYNIVKCPKCGRYGRLSEYEGNSRTEKFAGHVIHKGHIELGMFNMIDDSCTLNEPQLSEVSWIFEKGA